MVPQTMALREGWPEGVPRQFEKTEVPFFAQDDYQCGPAALATILANAGVKVTPDELVSKVYIPERKGSLQAEMLATPRQYGLVGYQLAPRYGDVLREVAAGNPVVILQNKGAAWLDLWHYAVVVGYDYPAGELYLRSGKDEREKMPFTIFEYTWKKSDYWAMVALPPGRIPVTATETAYVGAIAGLERVGDKATVTKAYTAALERWPGSVGASVGLANQYYAQGNLKDTEAVLRRAAQAHPESIVVANNLAQTLSDQGRNSEALTLLDKAGPAEPQFAAAVAETRALIEQRLAKAR
ncbi:MAG: PA2778 family cysteine peptidase [Betaproteobacteria bacterium]